MSRTPAGVRGDRVARLIARIGTGAPAFWIPFALLFAVASCWAFAGPVFSAPDENAHATKAIAQWRGQMFGHQRTGSQYPVVDLPAGDRYSPSTLCFVFHSEVPANCPAQFGDPSGTPWFSTWVSTYDPVYYFLVGWPSTFLTGPPVVYAMRLVSAAISSALLALAVGLLAGSRRRRATMFAALFAASPMIIYLVAAVNPNGLEISSGALLWVALLRLLDEGSLAEERRGRLGALIACAAAAGVLLANCRSLGPFWVLLIAVVAVLSARLSALRGLLRIRHVWVGVAVIAAASVFSIVWTLRAGSLSGQAATGDAPLVGGTFFQGFANTVRLTPMYLRESIGVFGWLDTELLDLAYATYLAAVVLVLGTCIARLRGRDVMLVTALIASTVLIPAVLQGISVRSTGIIWQGRYGLVLAVGLMIVTAWLAARHHLPARVRRTVATIAAALLWAYGAVAFFLVLRRYVVGTDRHLGAMLRAPDWQPPGTWIVLTAAFAITSALFLAWVLSTMWWSRPERRLQRDGLVEAPLRRSTPTR